jgi:hypothetical protein
MPHRPIAPPDPPTPLARSVDGLLLLYTRHADGGPTHWRLDIACPHGTGRAPLAVGSSDDLFRTYRAVADRHLVVMGCRCPLIAVVLSPQWPPRSPLDGVPVTRSRPDPPPLAGIALAFKPDGHPQPWRLTATCPHGVRSDQLVVTPRPALLDAAAEWANPYRTVRACDCRPVAVSIADDDRPSAAATPPPP